jgi:hypothetical protein
VDERDAALATYQPSEGHKQHEDETGYGHDEAWSGVACEVVTRVKLSAYSLNSVRHDLQPSIMS